MTPDATSVPHSADVVVVGGGHNGLACACYLAAAGLDTVVVERRDVVGGAAVTEKFAPGFRNSTASYTVSLLNPRVIRDLRLHENGLRIVERPLPNFMPLSDREAFVPGNTLAETQKAVAQWSRADAERLPEYERMLERVADVLRSTLLETPPNVGGGWRDLGRALRFGGRLRGLDMAARRDLLDLIGKSAGDLLDGWFESKPLKALFGFDSVVGNYASPYTPGSAYVLLHHVFGEVNGRRGAWGHAIGGMGAITQAMAREAGRRGVRILTGRAVERIDVVDGRARAVALDGGDEIRCRAVAANVSPRMLYLDLLPASELDAEFLRRIRGWRCGSATFRMNVALSELPRFTCRPENGPHLGAGIVMAPGLDYMDRAYVDARRDGWSAEPVIEMLVPSTLDDTLAPEGRHVASLFCQHFSPELPGGRSWDDCRDRAADHIIDTVTRYAPNFRDTVIGRSALSPLDLERRFGLPSGDIFHGALTPDQLFSARPVLGHADYRAPVRGVYMCGSGTHPGGGVTGAPGHNAAKEMIRDLRAPLGRKHSGPHG